jgi:glycosyltransferase involved in cell wall biosynthesis
MQRSLGQWVDRYPAQVRLPSENEFRTTVVVPCYNHAEYLPLAVQSLVEQSLPAFDTVLIDDASDDGTNGLLQDLAEALSSRGNVTLVTHRRNLGQAATLNEAINLSATPFVTVLNDDDWLTDEALSHVLRVHRQNPRIALVGAASEWFSGDGRPPGRTIGEPLPVRLYAPDEVRQFRQPNDLNMTHSGMTLSRHAWHVVGGYRVDVRERVVPYTDRDLQLRLAALFPVAVVESPLVWWRSDSSVDAGLNS